MRLPVRKVPLQIKSSGGGGTEPQVTEQGQMDWMRQCNFIIAIFKNSANQNSIFAICSLRMLLVH